MIPMTLKKAATDSNGILLGDIADGEKIFSAVATDTRKPMPQSLFIAIRGEQFDGHNYVDKAIEQGAVACMLDEAVTTSIPVIKVEDTVKAMGQLAKALRNQIAPLCVGITGSCGKTTVKEMVASILSHRGNVLSTKGNFNNAIGVPLTLFRLTNDDEFAVIELGASKPGDIDEIAQLVTPDVALINNISAAHLQGLGDIEGVASVKSELLEHLQPAGTAVLEHDSPWLSQWKNKLQDTQQLYTFSLTNSDADFYASEISQGTKATFLAKTVAGDITIHLPLPGKHNVANALAAMAAAISLGATLDNCQKGLQDLSQIDGRLRLLAGLNGSQIIDDSYNANPASLKAAMEVLQSFPGVRVLVLGDMAELGDEATSAHQETGRQARAMGLDAVYATGEFSRFSVEAFGEGGRHFSTRDELADALAKEISSQWTLLVKGSRSAAMETIVKILQPKEQSNQLQGSTKQHTGTQICY